MRTPSPWHAEIFDGEPIAVTGMDGGRKIRIATMEGASSNPDIVADARFLVRAVNSHDDLLAALKRAIKVADEAAREWDVAPSGMKAGKLLLALCGHLKSYRGDITSIHDAIANAEGKS